MLTENEKYILKTTIWDNPYIPKTHIPFAKQLEALLDFRTELLFGGSAGGGKSDYLLMAALQFVNEPKYNAIIFRRSYTDLMLPEGLIPRSHEWLTGTPAKWKPDIHQWVFPSGSTVTFGYLESENDIYRYKSSEYTAIMYEELTEFPYERFYTYLFSRMRKAKDCKIPLRMRATTIPDGPGADWVYERFQPDSPQPLPDGKRFLKSLLYDNPHIDQVGYSSNLEEIDPVTRMQLQQGVWRVKKSGNKFKQTILIQHITKDKRYKEHQHGEELPGVS